MTIYKKLFGMENFALVLCVSLLLGACACRRYEQVVFGWKPKQGSTVTFDYNQAMNECVDLQKKYQKSVQTQATSEVIPDFISDCMDKKGYFWYVLLGRVDCWPYS